MVPLGITSAMAYGPNSAPAKISPRTAGSVSRSKISPVSLATRKMTNISRSSDVTSAGMALGTAMILTCETLLR